MSKNRPYVPPPILTPPSVVVPRESARPAPASVSPAPVAKRDVAGDFVPGAPLAVVQPPARVTKVELLADRIVLTNPTIRLDAWLFLPGTKTQTQELKPATAVIMHNEIIIDELGVIWPVARAHITTR